MLDTFKSLPEDPDELRTISAQMAQHIQSLTCQIEKLKAELHGHPLPGRRFAKQICREGQGAFRLQVRGYGPVGSRSVGRR